MKLTPADELRYEGVIARLGAEVAGLPAALCELAGAALTELAVGTFSRMAALLPWWLAELAPLDDERCAALGRAGLYAWWHGQCYDAVLDRGLAPAALPLAQHALWAALDGYAALGLLAGAPWADLAARLAASAAAYAAELGGRPVDPATVDDARLAAWTVDLLMDRAAPFGFAVTAQLWLAGVPAADRRWADLPEALRCLSGARQIADDAGDWHDDLGAGQLNWVAAGLIRAFRASHAAAEGSLERLVGYELQAEGFWAEVERAHDELCARALARLGAYGPCRLRLLIEGQWAEQRRVFAAMGERRAALRALLGGGV